MSKVSVVLAKSRRPIIEPMGDFFDLLYKYDQLKIDAQKKLAF